MVLGDGVNPNLNPNLSLERDGVNLRNNYIAIMTAVAEQVV